MEQEQAQHKIPYPSDVSDDEWAFVAPYLTLMTETAPQREHSLREVFNGLRWIVRSGAQWRMMPKDLPPWYTVYQQTQRWLNAGVFEAIVHDLREVLRVASGRNPQPSAAIFDSRTMQSSPESGARAGYDGAKRRKGSKSIWRWTRGPLAGLARHASQRTRPCAGRPTGPTGSSGDRTKSRGGLR